MAKKKILHLSPHLGGGVGKVLLNYLLKTQDNTDFQHQIACLDYINPQAKDFLSKHHISHFESIYDAKTTLNELIDQTDILIIHWWNHPLLMDILIRFQLPANRLAIWSHVNGDKPPNIFFKRLFNFPDLFIFTTPMSYLSPAVNQFDDAKKFRHIWSTGGIEHTKNIIKRKNKSFTVGYIGTVDYAKLHPDFIHLCLSIKIPDVKFIICGNGSSLDSMQKEIEEKKLSAKFTFAGQVNDIMPYLSQFDVFGYPLNHNHFGTCDQVIAETMSAGIAPVVLNNNMENHMVHHQYSGLVANDLEQYVDYIELLYHNEQFKEMLQSNAKNEALKRFSIEKTISDWGKIFSELLLLPKTDKNWDKKRNNEALKPIDIFLSSIGEHQKLFIDLLNQKDKKSLTKIRLELAKNETWFSQTKGSPQHYLSFFNTDKQLQKICDKI
ncbi:MAG: glycosyltransferase [Gammaproteobacteria bacterium]|nr:glycosyltransferase [Gammaproteobacteria bacterium]